MAHFDLTHNSVLLKTFNHLQNENMDLNFLLNIYIQSFLLLLDDTCLPFIGQFFDNKTGIFVDE